MLNRSNSFSTSVKFYVHPQKANASGHTKTLGGLWPTLYSKKEICVSVVEYYRLIMFTIPVIFTVENINKLDHFNV